MKVMITIPVSTTKKYNPDILPDSFNIQQIPMVTLSFWHYINNKTICIRKYPLEMLNTRFQGVD